MTESDVRFSRLVADREVEIFSSAGDRLAEINVVRIASNGTYLSGVTDSRGVWSFTDPFIGTVTILAAAERWSGAFQVMEEEEWDGPLRLYLEPLTEGGSTIFPQGTGYIPGLEGRLNPIRDTHARTYIYGDNLSFEQQPEQPFRFLPGQEFSVTDSKSNVFVLTVLAILGRTSLVRYRLSARSPLEKSD